MKILVELSVNGERFEIATNPHATLLEVLRNQLGLTGAKEACGTGECGSCTVLADGRPILACLALAADYQDCEITTIEGLQAGSTLTPVQESFLEKGAVQCGFCTPGMVLSATALLKKNPAPTLDQIRKALEGNLCRCTGYNKILEAVRAAGEKMSQEASGSSGQ